MRYLRDPRVFQIAFLTALLLFGALSRDFAVDGARVAVVMATVLATQALAIWGFGLGLDSLLSASISGLSLLLLLRSGSLGALMFAAVLAIASKFTLRWRGKHFFNPTCFGIVMLLLFTDWVWISPGQWGSERLACFWFVALGMTVVHRSRRSDTAFFFLGVYLLLLTARVLYLGQRVEVLAHQAQSGALLLFAFFMISDPRSTPDHRAGRFLFAAAVALASYYIRFHLYNANALLLALFFLSPLTLFLDILLKHSRYQWRIPEPINA